jgi:hypothetical protein
LAEIHEALVSPAIVLGEQSVPVSGTIDTGNHFILDPDGRFTVYDELWRVVSTEHLGSGLLPTDLASFSIQSGSSSNIWLEVGVQASNETMANPDPTAPIIWDGGGGDDAWTTAGNWLPDSVPAASQHVVVGRGASVTNAQQVFTSLDIRSGAKVTFGEILANKDVTIAGTLDDSLTTAMRFVNCVIELSGNLGSNITFLDTNDSEINFVDGAAFLNPGGMDFEIKGSNTYGYRLSETGFTTMAADVLRNGAHFGATATWNDVTFNIDVSAYDVANGTSIVLADYASVGWSGDDLVFDPTVHIVAGGSDLSGILSFDTDASALVLTLREGHTSKGTPHSWLSAYGLVVGGDYEAADRIDSDFDGMLNWEEHVAGTIPTNSASVLEAAVVHVSTNQLVIDWQAVSARTYTVWLATNLVDAAWTQKVVNVPGIEPSITSTVQFDGARAFLRVGVKP